MTTAGTPQSSLPEPPLFVEISVEGRPAIRSLAVPGTLGTDWPEGPWDCRVSSPGGHVADGWIDRSFPLTDGAAYALFRGLFPPSLGTLDLWLDADAPATGFDAPPDIQLWHDDGRRLAATEWSVVRATADDRLLSIHVSPPARRGGCAVEMVWSGGPPLFASVHRRSYMYHAAPSDPSPEWRVVDDLDLPNAYWSFHRNGLLTAAGELARHLLDRADGFARGRRAPEDHDATLAIGHAAVNLRFLGVEFRQRAAAALSRSKSRTLDLQALRWLSRHGAGQTEEDTLEGLSQRLATERPFHTEVLRLLLERMVVAAERSEAREVTNPVVARALSTISSLADATVWSSGTLAYRARSPGMPVPDVEWPEQAGIIAAQKKKPADPRTVDLGTQSPPDTVSAPTTETRKVRRTTRTLRLTKAQRTRLLRKLLKLYGMKRSKLRVRRGRRAGGKGPQSGRLGFEQANSRVVYAEDLRLDALGEIARRGPMRGTFLGTTVVVRPAAMGSGISGPEVAKGVLDSLGLQDLSVEIFGAGSLYAVANATLVAIRTADTGNSLLSGIPARARDTSHAA